MYPFIKSVLTCVLQSQVKENKVKKVKEMDLNPFISSENSLLAEKSFVSLLAENGFVSMKETPPFANGIEWKEKIPNGSSAIIGFTKVCITEFFFKFFSW